MIGIVVSQADTASAHIGKQLREICDWDTRRDQTQPEAEGGGTVYYTDSFEMRMFDEWHLELENVAERFDDPDLIVFPSRHSGETGKLLTAHHTGNFGPAEYGGMPQSFAKAAPHATKQILHELESVAPEGYDVGMECTHHGPTTVGAPSLFVEVGSDTSQWEDPAAAKAVAKAILQLEGVSPQSERQVVGIGGGHYAPRFTRIVKETDWAVGHIAANWSLDDLKGGTDTLSKIFDQSDTEYVVFDGEHPNLRSRLEDRGYTTLSETWIRETTDVPLSVVTEVESTLGSTDSGTRFGTQAAKVRPDDIEYLSLPTDLIDTIQGIDRERTLGLLDTHCVGYTTAENGNRARSDIAINTTEPRHGDTVVPAALISDIEDVLVEKYDTVTVEQTRIQVESSEFDPQKAQTFGVPEGPAFGKLASGQSVEVDGRTIPPEEVSTKTTTTFELPANS